MLDSTPDIADFARNVLGRPLYPYQAEIAAAILDSIRGGHGRIFTVMLARQSGKNQLSAVIEAYLLATQPAGTIIKAAPTFNPQITNSRERLDHWSLFLALLSWRLLFLGWPRALTVCAKG